MTNNTENNNRLWIARLIELKKQYKGIDKEWKHLMSLFPNGRTKGEVLDLRVYPSGVVKKLSIEKLSKVLTEDQIEACMVRGVRQRRMELVPKTKKQKKNIYEE